MQVNDTAIEYQWLDNGGTTVTTTGPGFKAGVIVHNDEHMSTGP